MPIPKPGSRFVDRNKIRRMYQEGYNVEQISRAVSIVPEHVEYVLEQWDIDEESFKNQQRAINEERDRQFRAAQAPVNPVPTIDEQEAERIRQEAIRQYIAEQENKPKRGRPPKAKTEASEDAA